MANGWDDGGISDRVMRFVDRKILEGYGFPLPPEPEGIYNMKNTHKHVYTCLATPPELEQFGLTHMICRVDVPDRPVAAFNSSQAASFQCDDLNGFANQDRPELDVNVEQDEIDNANKVAQESELLKEQVERREQNKALLRQKIKDAESKMTQAAVADIVKSPELSLQQKLDMAQAAAKG